MWLFKYCIILTAVTGKVDLNRGEGIFTKEYPKGRRVKDLGYHTD